MQDSFLPTIGAFSKAPAHYTPILPVFGEDIEVLPLGLFEGPTAELVFKENFDPRVLDDKQLNSISRLVNEKIEAEKKDGRKIDFRDIDTIYQLYLFEEELKNQIEEEDEAHFIEGNLKGILKTLKFYETIADLTDIQREILKMKEEHKKNQEIAGYINKKYGKSYTANYISTIFKQKIIVKINEAVKLHQDTIENCFFPENFKRCKDCGQVLLLTTNNFVRQKKSKDGFAPRCKRCERKKRSRYK